MLLVISPAKTLDFESPLATSLHTQPRLLADAQQLIDQLRQLSPEQVSSLMGISDKLGLLNYERFQDWHLPFTPDNARPAVLAFKGDVYTGMEAEKFSKKDFNFAQKHLRILSGLYGLLRPLDLIQPYRLEMGTRLRTKRGANLYDFWGSRIAEQLNADAGDHLDPTLVNLASHEYFGAVDARALQIPTVTIHFREETDGELKMVSFYAKRARGLMARYLIDRRLERSQDLKDFDRDGYRFDAALSTDQDWTFVRPHPPLKGA